MDEFLTASVVRFENLCDSIRIDVAMFTIPAICRANRKTIDTYKTTLNDVNAVIWTFLKSERPLELDNESPLLLCDTISEGLALQNIDRLSRNV